MNYCKTLKTTAAAISLAVLTNGAVADEQLRGAMTAVSNVASAISDKSDYNNFRWINKSSQTGSVVNNTQRPSGNTFKWAEGARQTGEMTASVDGEQSASRWVMRNDADQSASRWVMRNDANQSASRWVMRNDANQSASRWVMRSTRDTQN